MLYKYLTTVTSNVNAPT